MREEDAFSAIELDALRELMNIGFGQAAVALSEAMDLYVTLSVPRIAVLEEEAVAPFVTRAVGLPPNSWSMVEQFFFGNFEGQSFLLMPEGEGRKLASLFSPATVPSSQEIEIGSLERDMVKEIANILIGACVGKIAELLHDQVAFQPPSFHPSPLEPEGIRKRLGHGDGIALLFTTLFEFEREDIEGHLFLVASERSVVWMKRAIAAFIESLS